MVWTAVRGLIYIYEGGDDETKGLTCTPGLSLVIRSANKSDLIKREQVP